MQYVTYYFSSITIQNLLSSDKLSSLHRKKTKKKKEIPEKIFPFHKQTVLRDQNPALHIRELLNKLRFQKEEE